MSSIDRSNENSTQIPGVSSWTHFKLDRRSPAGRGSDGFGYRVARGVESAEIIVRNRDGTLADSH